MTELGVVTTAGNGASVGSTAGGVAEAAAAGVRDRDGDGLADGGGPVTVTDPVAAGIAVIGGLVPASAVAVSVTEVPRAMLDATVICACS
jgi:hypothetical protein